MNEEGSTDSDLIAHGNVKWRVPPIVLPARTNRLKQEKWQINPLSPSACAFSAILHSCV